MISGRKLYKNMRPVFLIILLFLAVYTYATNIEGREFVLENGLKVIVVEDHKAPIVACRLYYKVGSVYEYAGLSGLSHMLEHMMFKGTEKIGVKDLEKDRYFQNRIDSIYGLVFKAMEARDSAGIARLKKEARMLLEEQRKHLINNELWETYLKAGGTHLNAFTSRLMTAYIVTLPANKIELFFWLESDRMKNPVLREFYPERDVVKEERRMRYEDTPYGRYFETLRSMFYEAHPYRIPTIGYMSDLGYLTREDALAHFRQYYVPNNSILVMVGDVTPGEVKKLSRKYFAPIQRSKEPVKEIHTKDPVQVGEKRLVMEKAVSPRIDFWFKTPGIGDDRLYDIDVIEGIFKGKSGRLHKRLVEKEKLCTSVSTGNYMNKYVSLFGISAVLKEETRHESVERIIWEEIEKIKSDTIFTRELQKVKNNVAMYQVGRLKSLEGMANELAFLELCGDWRMINEYPQKIEKVTPDKVKNAAVQFLKRKNLTVGNVINVPDQDKK
jgi:predicted Zn-dependent peptidase